MKVGDKIEVIDRNIHDAPLRGIVIDLDEHPFKESFAKIEVEGAGLPVLTIWVNIRLSRVLETENESRSGGGKIG